MVRGAAQVDIDIRIEAEGWRAPQMNAEAFTRDAAIAALKNTTTAAPSVELSVLLTDDATIAGLNEQWRGKAGPTNVLSFPGEVSATGGGDPAVPVLLGDVAIALETVVAEAASARIPVSDHLRHLVVHGVLHLLGYDHEDDTDAERMESREIEILCTLGVPDPYSAADRRMEHAP